jgi:uncharacterized membrane protein YtjA (UPF0391 family)
MTWQEAVVQVAPYVMWTGVAWAAAWAARVLFR